MSGGGLNLDPTPEEIREQLRRCHSTADTFTSAAEAGDKIRAAVGWYIQHYRVAPYDSRKFMGVISRILRSNFGRMMMSGERQRLLGLVARAMESTKDEGTRRGRPAIPLEIKQVAAYLADIEHDENDKKFTLERRHYENGVLVGTDQAYQRAADRLKNDFGIEIRPESIKDFREEDNKT